MDKGPTWTVKFADGYVQKYGARRMRQLLKNAKAEKVGNQLDYIIVSNRWKSSINDCRPRWGPSIHRSLDGEKGDHALVGCTWKWRLRMVKSEPVRDFSLLIHKGKDENGEPIGNEHLTKFEAEIEKQLTMSEFDDQDSSTLMHQKICDAILNAAHATLPKKRKGQGSSIVRKVSEETKKLYARRSRMSRPYATRRKWKGPATKVQYKQTFSNPLLNYTRTNIPYTYANIGHTHSLSIIHGTPVLSYCFVLERDAIAAWITQYNVRQARSPTNHEPADVSTPRRQDIPWFCRSFALRSLTGHPTVPGIRSAQITYAFTQ